MRRRQSSGSGAVLAAVETASGRAAEIGGKPEPHLFEMALEAIGAPGRGWRWSATGISSDIDGGRAAGLETVLVLSGTSSRREAEAADAAARPRARGPRRPAAVSVGSGAGRAAPRPQLRRGSSRSPSRPGRGRLGAAGPAPLRARTARRRRPRGRDRDRRLRGLRAAAAARGRAPRRPLGPQADGARRAPCCSPLSGLLNLPDLGLAGLIVARLILGVGEGSLYTAGSAWIVDLAPPARRGRVLGLYGLAVWGGLSVGPLAGELLLDAGGYTAVWIFAAALPLLGGADRDPRPRPLRAPRPRRAAPADRAGGGPPRHRDRARLRSATPRSPPSSSCTSKRAGSATAPSSSPPSRR